jgi:hypothetical protein
VAEIIKSIESYERVPVFMKGLTNRVRLFVLLMVLLLILAGFGLFSALRQPDCCVFLVSPVPYETFQRDWTTNTGSIHIVVDASDMGDALPVEVKWIDSVSHDVQLTRTDTLCPNHASYQMNCVRYEGDLTALPPGQALFQMRLNQPLRNAFTADTWITAAYVGIGDVFVMAGQSNSVGYAQQLQTYLSDQFVASMYTRQGQWAELDDLNLNMINGLRPGFWPTLHLNSGSPWPILGTRISEFTHAPVAFIPTGIGGLEIKGWAAEFYVYPFIVEQVKNSGVQPAAILWQQGESDIYAKTGYDAYKAGLISLAERSQQDMNLPLIAAVIGPIPDAEPEALEQVQSAILDATEASDAILPGPDFGDQILVTDGLHFQTDAEIAYFAEKWLEALKAAGLPGG